MDQFEKLLVAVGKHGLDFRSRDRSAEDDTDFGEARKPSITPERVSRSRNPNKTDIGLRSTEQGQEARFEWA